MSTLKDIRHTDGLVSRFVTQGRKPGTRLADIEPFAHYRVHEAQGHQSPALALILANSIDGLTFWIAIGERARALRARGVEPYVPVSELVCVEVADRKEALWAGEEALRCRGAGLVVLQMRTGPDLFESRRLQIAAQAGGTTGLILISRRAQSSAAQTRWQCDGGSEPDTTWHWSLTKNKQGRLGDWSVRGDPDPARVQPLDLLPQDLLPFHDTSRLYLTSHPRALVSGTPARPLAPA